MRLNEYQESALRTAPRGLENYPHSMRSDAAAGLRVRNDQMIWALGLTGEAGEVADYLKKVFGHGHAYDRRKLIGELGDVLWYFGLTLEEVAEHNVQKLHARYPDGFRAAR